MADPTLKRTRALITYTGSDDYRAETSWSSTRAGATPEGVFLEAFEELSRLLHLFGFGEEAMRRAAEAGERVRVSRGMRT